MFVFVISIMLKQTFGCSMSGFIEGPPGPPSDARNLAKLLLEGITSPPTTPHPRCSSGQLQVRRAMVQHTEMRVPLLG